MSMLPLALLLSSLQPDVPPARTPEAILSDIPHVSIQTYVIDDSRFPQLTDAIRAARRTTPQGEPALVVTTWRYYWGWTTDERGQCDPASATTDLRISVVLPTLSPEARFTDAERERWSHLLAELVAYQRDRMLIFVSGRNDTVRAMKAATDCASIEQAARQTQETVRSALRTYDESQVTRRRRFRL